MSVKHPHPLQVINNYATVGNGIHVKNFQKENYIEKKKKSFSFVCFFLRAFASARLLKTILSDYGRELKRMEKNTINVMGSDEGFAEVAFPTSSRIHLTR